MVQWLSPSQPKHASPTQPVPSISPMWWEQTKLLVIKGSPRPCHREVNLMSRMSRMWPPLLGKTVCPQFSVLNYNKNCQLTVRWTGLSQVSPAVVSTRCDVMKLAAHGAAEDDDSARAVRLAQRLAPGQGGGVQGLHQHTVVDWRVGQLLPRARRCCCYDNKTTTRERSIIVVPPHTVSYSRNIWLPDALYPQVSSYDACMNDYWQTNRIIDINIHVSMCLTVDDTPIKMATLWQHYKSTDQF